MMDKNTLETLVADTLNISVGTTGNNYATVDIYSITGALFGDGRCKAKAKNVQVDLYYLYEDERNIAADLLQNTLGNQSNCTFPLLDMYHDDIADRYRATLTCSLF